MSAGGPSLVRLPAIADEHPHRSRELILQAAEQAFAGAATSGPSAIVLGVGRGNELPLMELGARCERLLLCDMDAAAIQVAARATQVQGRQLQTREVDLIGITADMVKQCHDAMISAGSPSVAIDELTKIFAEATPQQPELGGPFDLVVASCLPTQLSVAAINQASAAFVARFPRDKAQLDAHAGWLAALDGFARRCERMLFDLLHALASHRGRIYLSESIQVCFVQLGPSGEWLTPGAYRMTRTLDLADEVDDRFAVEARGTWAWVAAVPTVNERGRVFVIQALVLRLQ